MTALDQKLALWIQVQQELRQARAQLEYALGKSGKAPPGLTDQVPRLQAQSDAAMHALQVEFDKLHRRPNRREPIGRHLGA